MSDVGMTPVGLSCAPGLYRSLTEYYSVSVRSKLTLDPVY